MWFKNVCDVLQINIELISIRNNVHIWVEHYGEEYDEKYNLGLVNNHYFINDTTNVTSYCLEHYDEVKELYECNQIYNENIIRELTDLSKHFNYSKH